MKNKFNQFLKFDAQTDASAGGAPNASTPAITPNTSTSSSAANAAATPSQTPASGSEGSGAAAPAKAAQGSGATSANWYDKISNQELKDYAIQKGFKDETMLLDSYKNLEKLKGAPADKLVQLPDTLDSPEMAKVFERLGKPAEAKDYGIQPVEGGLPAEMLGKVQEMFLDANLTKSQADKVVQKWNEMNQAATAASVEAAKAKMANDVNELKAAWGNAYEQNLNIAKSAAAEFGIKPEVVVAMEQQIGTKAAMEFFKSIGSKLGEAKFQQGDGKSQGFGRMSPEVAQAHIKTWKQDKDFMAKYANKSSAEYKQFSEAMKDAYPGEMPI